MGRIGEHNPAWRGEKAGYSAIHMYVKKRLHKPDLCQKCGLYPPSEMHNISGKYSRSLDDWIYLCQRCHKSVDILKRMVDMSDRKCSICNGLTYIQKKNGRPQWSYLNGNLICNKCDCRERRKTKLYQ